MLFAILIGILTIFWAVASMISLGLPNHIILITVASGVGLGIIVGRRL